jgi:hypothetical protein
VAERVGDYVLFAHSAASPSDAEWSDCIALLASVVLDRVRVLVWTDGGAPNAAQRAALDAAWASKHPLTAVLTPSTLRRIVGAAATRANPGVRFFSPEQHESAFDHLRTEYSDRERLLDRLTLLRAELERARTAEVLAVAV